MARTLINVPRNPRRGEIIEIRTMISHSMETGYRPGSDGRVLPRDIIQRFTCRYNGELVFSAELYPAIAANPSISFHTVAVASGTLTFQWEGDKGFSQTENVPINVVA